MAVPKCSNSSNTRSKIESPEFVLDRGASTRLDPATGAGRYTWANVAAHLVSRKLLLSGFYWVGLSNETCHKCAWEQPCFQI